MMWSMSVWKTFRLKSCCSSTIAICFAVCEHHVGHFCCCVLVHVECCNNLTAIEDNKTYRYLIQNEGIAHAQECYYGHIVSIPVQDTKTNCNQLWHQFSNFDILLRPHRAFPDMGSFLNNDQFAVLHNILSVVGVFRSPCIVPHRTQFLAFNLMS